MIGVRPYRRDAFFGGIHRLHRLHRSKKCRGGSKPALCEGRGRPPGFSFPTADSRPHRVIPPAGRPGILPGSLPRRRLSPDDVIPNGCEESRPLATTPVGRFGFSPHFHQPKRRTGVGRVNRLSLNHLSNGQVLTKPQHLIFPGRVTGRDGDHRGGGAVRPLHRKDPVCP